MRGGEEESEHAGKTVLAGNSNRLYISHLLEGDLVGGVYVVGLHLVDDLVVLPAAAVLQRDDISQLNI